MRKKVAMTLDQRYIMMIDNAYYSVNPPITEARSQGRKLTPIQEYIEKLIFSDLSSHNTEKVRSSLPFHKIYLNKNSNKIFIDFFFQMKGFETNQKTALE